MNVIGLPEGWKMAREIDLLHDRQTFLRVNKLCAGLTVGVLALGLVISLLWPWAFPLAGWGAQAVAALLGTLAYMLLHEAVHGVCIWAYVRRRPHFGFGGGYIWTGLKDAYFDKRSYLVIALSPVVVWGVVWGWRCRPGSRPSALCSPSTWAARRGITTWPTRCAACPMKPCATTPGWPCAFM